LRIPVLRSHVEVLKAILRGFNRTLGEAIDIHALIERVSKLQVCIDCVEKIRNLLVVDFEEGALDGELSFLKEKDQSKQVSRNERKDSTYG